MLADLSVNHVERRALLCGFAVHRITHDYGIDLLIATYNLNGEVENGEIRVQVKATDQLKTIARGQYAVVRVHRVDFRHWLLEPMPVILILYDSRNDIAYWIHVQSYYRTERTMDLQKEGTKITIRIPCAQVLDLDAMRLFATYRNEFLGQLRRMSQHD